MVVPVQMVAMSHNRLDHGTALSVPVRQYGVRHTDARCSAAVATVNRECPSPGHRDGVTQQALGEHTPVENHDYVGFSPPEGRKPYRIMKCGPGDKAGPAGRPARQGDRLRGGGSAGTFGGGVQLAVGSLVARG